VTCFQYFTRSLGQDDPSALPAERIEGQPVGGDWVRLLGINPVLGRWFTADEEREAAPVALLSYSQWQRRFEGSPDVLGKQVRLDAEVFTVIGVMPEGFDFLGGGGTIDYWHPFRNPPAVANSPVRFVQIPARLREGVTLQQAQAEMDVIGRTLAEELPATNEDWGIRLEPVRHYLTSGARRPLLIFQSAVAFVLLIACANVAGLLLAQGLGKQKELAVRTALGSSRMRIVKQLLTESVVLGLIGGIAGLAIGWAGLQLFLGLGPSLTTAPVTIDTRVLGFTLVLSIATGIVFGTVPALQVTL
jgi:putative ABC transport system permease protein